MEYRKLSKSSLMISEITLGCWILGGDPYGAMNDDDSIHLIQDALERGINAFDTAEGYGDGHSEEVLAKALGGQRDRVCLCTKISANHMRKAATESSCEASLRRLKTDCIDVYFFHYPSEETPVAETMGAMQELQAEGKIRLIGLSNFSLKQMEETAKWGRYDVIQPGYNLFWRFIEKEIRPYCLEHEISIMPYSPLAQGLLTGRYQRDWQFKKDDWRLNLPLFQPDHFARCVEAAEAMRPIAARYGKSLAQLAINWLNAKPGVTSSIIGARNARQLEDNLGACGWKISEADMEALDYIGRRVTDHLPNYLYFFFTMQSVD
jgi:aryl-alcohol dehydrogenase-like predicted oxidoreductase